MNLLTVKSSFQTLVVMLLECSSLIMKSFRLLIFQASNSAVCRHFPLSISIPRHLLSSHVTLFLCSVSLCPVFPHTLMQIESFKLHFREKARSRTDHGADIIIWPASADGSAQPHLLRNSVSLNDSIATAGLPRSHTTPTLLSSQEQGGNVGSLDGLLT